jgi:vancomycin permeability regulator SanA
MKQNHKRTLLRLLVIALLSGMVLILAARHLVLSASRDRVFSELSTAVRPANAALVLGCAKILPDGRDNLYFQYRVDAAADLCQTGLARHHGIDATGYAARDVTASAGLRTRLRENLARIRAVLDLHLLRTSPKFLGDPIPLDA